MVNSKKKKLKNARIKPITQDKENVQNMVKSWIGVTFKSIFWEVARLGILTNEINGENENCSNVNKAIGQPIRYLLRIIFKTFGKMAPCTL